MSQHTVGWLWGPKQPRGGIAEIGPKYQHLYEHMVHYASLAFDSERAYRAHGTPGRYIFRLDDHTVRLLASAELFSIGPHDLTVEVIARACVEVLARNPDHTYLRPMIYRGEGLGIDPAKSPVRAAVISAPWGKYLSTGLHNDGVKAMLTDWCRPRADQYPVRAKGSAGYAVGQMLKVRAVESGYAEAILRAPDRDYLGEATGMNIMLVLPDDTIVTPDASAGILLGITRATVIEIAATVLGDRWRVIERPVRIEELRDAREIFFTGTATEITPVTWIDDQEVGPGQAGDVTLALQRTYLDIVLGKNQAYAHWLTYVPDRAAVAVG